MYTNRNFEKPETLKHVEIIKVQHITVYDTSLDRS